MPKFLCFHNHITNNIIITLKITNLYKLQLITPKFWVVSMTNPLFNCFEQSSFKKETRWRLWAMRPSTPGQRIAWLNSHTTRNTKRPFLRRSGISGISAVWHTTHTQKSGIQQWNKKPPNLAPFQHGTALCFSDGCHLRDCSMVRLRKLPHSRDRAWRGKYAKSCHVPAQTSPWLRDK